MSNAIEPCQTNRESWPCLLCGETRGENILSLTGTQLIALWRAVGQSFSPKALGPIQGDFQIWLRRCAKCGFVSNDPALAGTEPFYRELNNADYFSTGRQEFSRTVHFAKEKGLRRVLDVGCGDGIFLDQARLAGLETHGLELNQEAAGVARNKGHRIYSGLLDELRSQPDRPVYDLITFFQVVEHLATPVQVLKDAAQLLRPGGYIAVAVPSAEGVYRLLPWDPAQWPPHHVSRWRQTDFEQLARVAGLKLVASGGDQLFGSNLEYFWKLHNRLARAIGKPAYFGGDRLAILTSFVFRKLGLKHLFRNSGNSIYAFFTTN